MGKANMVVINTTETEIDFMKRYIGALCALDERIVCDTTVDEQYDMTDISHIPVFNFTIDNNVVVRITRPANLDTGCYSYTFSIVDTSYSITSYVSPGNPGQAKPLSVYAREICFAYIVTDNFILLSLTGSQQYSGGNLDFVYIKEGSKFYTAINTNITWTRANLFNISARQLYENGITPVGTFVSRFQYAAPAGKIDYVKNSVYQNNGTKAFNLSSLYDCSTVSAGDCVSLADGAYLAVGPHQVVRMIASA